jgi:hypothetical protein
MNKCKKLGNDFLIFTLLADLKYFYEKITYIKFIYSGN